MPLSLSRGACIVEAAVWIPNFVPPPFFLTVASKHSGKNEKEWHHRLFFSATTSTNMLLVVLTGDSQARNGGAYMRQSTHQAHSVCSSALSEAAVKVRCCTTWPPRTYTTVVQRPC
ncbi:hypothetical protein H0G86_004246 [Trichoderma simmonsii]|uniref:Uncharacterized protein n=1 Tax=Trichoderma simmonsii TaxID=1491479 RepID=A0A8G0L784_9HYPO|nr:hypothetical protein H0G86_004246 [Trichoderma simmonsii]